MKKTKTKPLKRGELIRRYFEILRPKEPQPTDAYPGSVEKIEVLIRRVERGEKLFSEDDCRDFEDERYRGRLFG